VPGPHGLPVRNSAVRLRVETAHRHSLNGLSDESEIAEVLAGIGRLRLTLFMKFMKEVSQVPLPINAEVGIEGIAGWQIVHNGYAINRSSPTMHKDFVEHKGVLRSFEKKDQDAFLMQFFKKLNENTGVPRPLGLYGR
jgi:hypothetical protein